MIGLAVLEYVANKISGLTVGQNCFYENLPVDPTTGRLEKYGVFLTTESAAMSRVSDERQFLTFYVAIGEGAKDSSGQTVQEKYETDRLADQITDVIRDADSDWQNLCKLTVSQTALEYRDVRLQMRASKQRGMTLTNGAIVKSVVAEVIYKKVKE